jgi:hypothetical protein
MDSERTRDQENSQRKPRGDRGLEPRSTANGFLLLEALPMLLAAVFITTAMPQALEIAANDANASAAIFTDSGPTDQGDRAFEGVEEEYEPLITDDLRTEGVMYALVDVPGAIGRWKIAHDISH